MARRHRLHSEASYRFERGVDRELPLRASAKAVALLASLGSGTIVPGCQHASVDVPPTQVSMTEDYPDQVAGVVYGLDTVTRRLRQLGCATEHDHAYKVLTVTAPSWCSDRNDPADLAEEVIRLEGYENVPVRRPRAFAGRGLTTRQRLRRDVGRGLAWAWLRRGAGRAVRVRRRRGRAAVAARRPAAADAGPGQPAQRRRAAAADHAAARPVPGTQPQHRPRLRRRRPVRAGAGRPDPAWRARRAAVAARGPGALVRGPDRAGGGAARPAAAPGRGAGRRPRATGLVGPGPSRSAGPTPSKWPARSAGSAGSAWTCAPPGRPPGTRAAAPHRQARDGSQQTEWLAGYALASCTRGSSRPLRSACPPGPARWSWTCRPCWPRRNGPVRCRPRRC